jgi:hypothetical protein
MNLCIVPFKPAFRYSRNITTSLMIRTYTLLLTVCCVVIIIGSPLDFSSVSIRLCYEAGVSQCCLGSEIFGYQNATVQEAGRLRVKKFSPSKLTPFSF